MVVEDAVVHPKILLWGVEAFFINHLRGKNAGCPPTRQHKGTKGKGAEQTKTNTKGNIKKGLKTKNGHSETIRPQCICVS